MKNQKLNEEISRIKGMMGMIMNEQFNGAQENGPSEMAKQIASDILSDVVNRPIEKFSILDDESVDSEVMFAFANESGSLYYYYNLEIGRYSSSTSATYLDPAEYSDAEYNLEFKYMEVNDGVNVLYKGNDFTDIMNVKLSNGKDVADYVYEELDEKIQIYIDESNDGEPDYER